MESEVLNSLVPSVSSTTTASSETIDSSYCSKVLVIGIVGGSGSGKTTIANKLVQNVGKENVAHISYDAYYKDLRHLTIHEREMVNFDHPDSLETSLFVEHITKLKNFQAVHIPVYDFTCHSRTNETVFLAPKAVLIVEGILLLASQEIRELLDITVYIDTEPDLRFIRRLRRDREERGRSVESITEQYLNAVRPMHIAFVEPFKQFADIILPGARQLDVAVDVLTIRIKHALDMDCDEVSRIRNFSHGFSNPLIFDNDGKRVM